MPAHDVTLSTLHNDLSKLCYTEMQMAKDTSPPFSTDPDQPKLAAQSQVVWAAANRLQALNASSCDQAKVDDAEAKTQAAQAMFDAINSSIPIAFGSQEVYQAVQEAVDAANLV